jgi:RNA polymerase sigma-70 factor (sigma-E family)
LRKTEAEFHAYVADRLDRWRRSAYLLCHDWHLADDIVSEAVIRLYRHWSRVSRADNPDAYAQRILTRCWLTERGRAWSRRERTSDKPPAHPYRQDDRIIERLPLAQLLRTLGPRQRAVLVLRFYLDHSVEETAEILGVTPGTVKSQCARAIEHLRTSTHITN